MCLGGCEFVFCFLSFFIPCVEHSAFILRSLGIWECFLYYSYFFTLFLRYTSRTTQFTHLSYTVQWVLVYSPSNHHCCKTFSSPLRETSYTLVVTARSSHPFPSSGPRQPLIYFLFPQICLFWTFHINGVIQKTVFCE